MPHPLGKAKRTAEELESSYEEAYRRWSGGESYSRIAAAMAGPPHFCGGKSTATDWVAAGYRLDADRNDPMNKRRAQRDAVGLTLREYRARLADDVTAGRMKRDTAYRLELEAIRLYVHTLGLRAAPQAARVRLTGDVPATGLPEDLARALAALPPDELLPIAPKEGSP